jgi:two-component system phosphate regulon response regulator PhoB
MQINLQINNRRAVSMKLVLVVEDEYGNSEVLQLLLETEGYRVVSASNGAAALEILKGETPALILSDFMMPKMNGAELGEIVRRDPALHDIPFVIMSGTDLTVVRQSFRDYDAFLCKPFDAASMLAIVARLVSSGRLPPPSSDEVSESMRLLLKGIELPPR